MLEKELELYDFYEKTIRALFVPGQPIPIIENIFSDSTIKNFDNALIKKK